MRSPSLDINLIRRACVEGDLAAIEELANTLRSNEARRRSRSAPHLTRREIEPNLVAHFLFRLIRACHGHGHVPPRELAELAQVHLGQDRPPAGSARRYVQRLEAEQYFREEPDLTNAEIARRLGVNRSSVGRWREAFSSR